MQTISKTFKLVIKDILAVTRNKKRSEFKSENYIYSETMNEQASMVSIPGPGAYDIYHEPKPSKIKSTNSVFKSSSKMVYQSVT